MNYKGKNILITGSRGFLGKYLTKALIEAGASVQEYLYDVRDSQKIQEHFSHQLDYVFHFGTPSSQVLFKRQPTYCASVTINSFINISNLCENYGVKLIYPSTGLLSQGQSNEYARCKAILEDIHLGRNLDALGLRIFATYGPGEGHKGNYASVPYLFAHDILVKDRSPEVFGDGNQKRDFIFIDDVVKAILKLAEEAKEPIIDVGSGKAISFNQVVNMINLVGGKNRLPLYTEKPANYIEETVANTKVLNKYFIPEVSLKDGIKAIAKELTGEESHNNHNDKLSN